MGPTDRDWSDVVEFTVAVVNIIATISHFLCWSVALFKQLPRTSNKTQLSSCYQSPKQFAIINIFNKIQKISNTRHTKKKEAKRSNKVVSSGGNTANKITETEQKNRHPADHDKSIATKSATTGMGGVNHERDVWQGGCNGLRVGQGGGEPADIYKSVPQPPKEQHDMTNDQRLQRRRRRAARVSPFGGWGMPQPPSPSGMQLAASVAGH